MRRSADSSDATIEGDCQEQRSRIRVQLTLKRRTRKRFAKGLGETNGLGVTAELPQGLNRDHFALLDEHAARVKARVFVRLRQRPSRIALERAASLLQKLCFGRLSRS